MRKEWQAGLLAGVGENRQVAVEMFTHYLQEVKADKEFLDFMLRTSADYRISDGQFASQSVGWSRQYQQLTAAVTNAREQRLAWAQAQLAKAEEHAKQFKESMGEGTRATPSPEQH
jgi:hypothetical protein